MATTYQPPFQITLAALKAIAEIGKRSISQEARLSSEQCRTNRIRTIQASLAIENNTLSVEQVTEIVAGKRVLGLPREIQEVRNAFATYELLDTWQPSVIDDLLAAHLQLMQGLADRPGVFRSSGVGIYREEKLVHMAPPADRVPTLMRELLVWLAETEINPLIASCVFHYEFEFIHPFEDGNGRMGRLWQTLILSQWQPIFAYLPVETVIHAQQEAYYQALSASDKAADATPFIEFMLQALLLTMQESAS